MRRSDLACAGAEPRRPFVGRGAPRTSSPNTSASAAAAAGRTSSTATGRPSSRAIVVNAASSRPQAVIQLGERRRVEVDVERVAVRRHPAGDVDADRRDLPRRRCEPDAGQPVDARARRFRARRACGSPPARGRGSSASRPGRAGSGRGSGSRRAARARGTSTCRRGSSRRPRRPTPAGTCSSPSSVRRPSVITGGCSSRTTVSGIAPCEHRPGERALELPRVRVGNEAEVEQLCGPWHGVRLALAPPASAAVRSR